MAVPEEARRIYEAEQGHNLNDAFDVQQQQYELEIQKRSRDLDRENMKLANRLAMPIYVPKR